MIDPRELISDDYRATLQETHRLNKWGGGGKSHVHDVMAWAIDNECTTILDYGCGRGTLKPAAFELDHGAREVREYDPGIPGKDALPEPADLVVATDVLEHIEPDRVYATLQHLRGLTCMAAFFVISLRPAKLILPDRRNAHLSIHDAVWWESELKAHGFNIAKTEMRKGLYVWATVDYVRAAA